MEARAELDSHAEVSVVGKNVLVVHDFDRPATVSGYDPNGPAQELKTISAALAYDDPSTGNTTILVVHQALYVPTMDHALLSPLQMRVNGIQVNECPKHLCLDPDETTHSIIIPDQDDEPYLIPMRIHRTSSYFPFRKPTAEEYDTCERRYELTFEGPEYDPATTMFEEQEDAALEVATRLAEEGTIGRGPRIATASASRDRHSYNQAVRTAQVASMALLHDISPVYDDSAFLAGLKSEVQVAHVELKAVNELSRRQGIQASNLAKNWGISPELAERTVRVTTQRGIRNVVHPTLSRRFRTNDRQLRYRRLPCTMFTDWVKSSVKSINGNMGAQVYATDFGWSRVMPHKKESLNHETLSLLFSRDGVPEAMVSDGARSQIYGQFRRKLTEAHCWPRQIEPHSPWQNACEREIGELKKKYGRDMVESGAPKVLWDDCLIRAAYVRSMTAHNIYSLGGDVPETLISGATTDISPWAEFKWFEWVKFRDTSVGFPEPKEILGRDMGPALDCGSAMTRKVMKANGQYEKRTSVRALTHDEWHSETEKAARKAFMESLHKKLGQPYRHEEIQSNPDLQTPEFEPYQDDEEEPHQVPDIDEEEAGAYDQYIGAEVNLPIGGQVLTGRVKERKRDREGNLIGKSHSNPVLDTRTYEVQFPDGQAAEYSANMIAESMFAQCDLEGNQYLLMDSICGHRKYMCAVEKADMYIKQGSNRQLRKTTKGWKLCIQWKDGTTSWERLADMKESNPIEVAEYAVKEGIHDEAAFAWWVPYVLRRRDKIIAAVNKRFQKRNHKFGIKIPTTVEEALRIDAENGNTLWRDAIEKEMKNVRVAFKVQEGDDVIPPNYEYIKCHMVFDVKMEDFRRKARLVASPHTMSNSTPPPASVTYASVVSRETVRIALTMAALNDLEVKTADVLNAFITAPAVEKLWTVLGPEFGLDAGKNAIITRSIYGTRTAAAAFRNHLADCMEHIGYKSCKADPDLWMKPKVRDDGFEYYSYILLYVDDALCIDHDPMSELRKIDKYFKFKEGSIADPDFYLGAKVKKVQLVNGVWAWSFSSSKYIQGAVQNVEEHLKKQDKSLPKKAVNPFPTNYQPELDTTPELSDTKANFFQNQIGILRWMVEMGRIDQITEVSMLSSFLAMPREGHLEALYHIFAYLKNKHNSRIVFDPTYPDIDHTAFKECDWKNIYGDVKEAVPPDAPEPRGKEVDLLSYVDSDHANDKATRRSRTGFFIFVNSAPIVWYSKRQSTCETSVFGAEFVALKQVMEALRGIRYKLRMMGIPISGPSYIFGDNMSVIHNTQRPESTLKKKSNSICYHAVREAVAMGECLTGHIPTDKNLADLATKTLTGLKRANLIAMVMHDIVEDHD